MFMVLNGHHGVFFFEIDYLREGECDLSNIPYLLFFRIKFYLIFIKAYVENLTLL